MYPSSPNYNPPPLSLSLTTAPYRCKTPGVYLPIYGYVFQSGHDSDGLEIRADVLSMATDWFASFERRFMPCLAATAATGAAAVASTAKTARGGGGRRGGGGPPDGFLPQAIARVLSEVSRAAEYGRFGLYTASRRTTFEKGVGDLGCTGGGESATG